jgi:hypothetical protein
MLVPITVMGFGQIAVVGSFPTERRVIAGVETVTVVTLYLREERIGRAAACAGLSTESFDLKLPVFEGERFDIGARRNGVDARFAASRKQK